MVKNNLENELKIAVPFIFLMIFIAGLVLMQPQRGLSAEVVTDYLILRAIDKFYGSSQPDSVSQKDAGILKGVSHWNRDHDDITYEIAYVSFPGYAPATVESIDNVPNNIRADMVVSVQVTQHAGSDSDKWLMHEAESDFRTYYGLPDDSFVARQIDNNTVIGLSVAGWTYRWASGYNIIQIQYHDPQMEKPEPIEIVKAYLAKHPSTLPTMTSADLRAANNNTTWIRDEVDRRLWLADKTVAPITAEEPKLYDKLDDVVRHLKVFLDYKEKYYGFTAEEKDAGMTAKSEKNVLSVYVEAKDLASIKAKLEAYKAWWAEHKGQEINL